MNKSLKNCAKQQFSAGSRWVGRALALWAQRQPYRALYIPYIGPYIGPYRALYRALFWALFWHTAQLPRQFSLTAHFPDTFFASPRVQPC